MHQTFPSNEIATLQLDQDGGLARFEVMSAKRITIPQFRHFLLAAAQAKASDVTVQTDAQPRIEINGQLYRFEQRPWTASEIEDILTDSYGAASGVAEIRGQKCLDYSYEIPLASGKRCRFRVNATGILVSNGSGIEMTFRVMPDDPPHWQEIGLTSREIKRMTPRAGLVVLAGPTGSGKSTTLAALTRYHLQNQSHPVKIVDIQAPIEFTYAHFNVAETGSPSLIGQSEIGRHLPSFAAAIRSALRRNPHIIVLGEARDKETIETAFEAALTGHLVYTTAHAGSVQDCVHRLLAPFPLSERDHRASDLAACLRFVMVQQLLPRCNHSGRVASREWMVFGPTSGILSSSPQQWSQRIQHCMQKNHNSPSKMAQTYEQCQARLAKQGLIGPVKKMDEG